VDLEYTSNSGAIESAQADIPDGRLETVSYNQRGAFQFARRFGRPQTPRAVMERAPWRTENRNAQSFYGSSD